MYQAIDARDPSAGSTLLGDYLRDVQLARRVAHTEACDLARRAQAGDNAARAQLIEANLALVIIIAREYRSPRIALIDLIQEGNLGLMHAITKFDWQRGIRFSTYASWWVRQAVRRAVRVHSRLVYLPDRAVEQLYHLRRVAAEMVQRMGREATAAELATACAMPVARVVHLLPFAHDPISLDAPLHDGDALTGQASSAAAVTMAAPTSPTSAALASQIATLLTALTPREQRIIELRFGLLDGHCLTQAETGAQLRLSRERIRQIENAALAKLRRAHQEYAAS